MRAAVWTGPGPDGFRVRDVPEPELRGPDEILVRVRAVYFGAKVVRAIRHGLPGVEPPLIMGRMLAGDVIARGPDVTHLGVGDRVTVDPDAPCGRCVPCRDLLPTDCRDKGGLDPGGMVEICRVPSRSMAGVVRVAPEVPYAEAAYTETLACVAHGILAGGVTYGDTVVVLGSGGVGLCHVPMARLRGATTVLVTGRHDEGLAVAAELGAVPVDIRREDVATVVAARTGGRGADVVIEAAGRRETYAEAVDLARAGGSIVAFGGTLPDLTVTLAPAAVHYRSLRLVGAHQYPPGLFRRTADLIASRRVDLRPILSHQLPLEEAARAIDVYQRPDCRTLSLHP